MAAEKIQFFTSMAPSDLYFGSEVPEVADDCGPIAAGCCPFGWFQKPNDRKYGYALAVWVRYYDATIGNTFTAYYPYGNLARREDHPEDIALIPYNSAKGRVVTLPEMRVEVEDGYKMKVFIDGLDALTQEEIVEKYSGDVAGVVTARKDFKGDGTSRWGEFLFRAVNEAAYETADGTVSQENIAKVRKQTEDRIKAAKGSFWEIVKWMYGRFINAPCTVSAKKKAGTDGNNKREKVFIMDLSQPRPANFGPGNTAAEDDTEETTGTPASKPVSKPAKAAAKGYEAPTDATDIKPIIIAAVDAKLAVAPKGAGALKSTVAVAMNEHYGEGQWDADEAMAMLTKLLASGRWKKNEADKYMPTPADADDTDEDDETEEDD